MPYPLTYASKFQAHGISREALLRRIQIAEAQLQRIEPEVLRVLDQMNEYQTFAQVIHSKA